jgi:hypothetical protein
MAANTKNLAQPNNPKVEINELMVGPVDVRGQGRLPAADSLELWGHDGMSIIGGTHARPAV